MATKRSAPAGAPTEAKKKKKKKIVKGFKGSSLPIHVDAALGTAKRQSLYTRTKELLPEGQDSIQGIAVCAPSGAVTDGHKKCISPTLVVCRRPGGVAANKELREASRDFRPLDDDEPIAKSLVVSAAPGSVILFTSITPHTNCGPADKELFDQMATSKANVDFAAGGEPVEPGLYVAKRVEGPTTDNFSQVSYFRSDVDAETIWAALHKDGVCVVEGVFDPDRYRAGFLEALRRRNSAPELNCIPGAKSMTIAKYYGFAGEPIAQELRLAVAHLFRTIFGTEAVCSSIDAPGIVLAKNGDFFRLCLFVAMLPRPTDKAIHATAVAQKTKAIEAGKSTDHWAYYVRTSGPGHYSNPRIDPANPERSARHYKIFGSPVLEEFKQLL